MSSRKAGAGIPVKTASRCAETPCHGIVAFGVGGGLGCDSCPREPGERDEHWRSVEQGYKNLETIIADDGASDGCMGTIQNLEDDRIRSLRQEHAGKAAVMNMALSVARSTFHASPDAGPIEEIRQHC
ncbi:MAG: glycosyltransferase [Planctomycetota bacterium]